MFIQARYIGASRLFVVLEIGSHIRERFHVPCESENLTSGVVEVQKQLRNMFHDMHKTTTVNNRHTEFRGKKWKNFGQERW